MKSGIEEELNRLSQISKPSIFAYKGYSIDFVSRLNKLSGNRSTFDLFIDDSFKVKLDEVNHNLTKFLSTCLAYESDILILPYLFLKILDSKLDLKLLNRDITIINNPIHSLYPYEFDHKSSDIEEIISKGGSHKIEENDSLNLMCASVERVGSHDYVTYLDLTEELEIQQIDVESKHEIIFVNNTIGNTIQFDDSGYYDLKWNIFFDEINQDAVITITNDSLNQKILSELSYLQGLYDLNGYNLRLIKKENNLGVRHRPELLHILNEYWQSDQFRTIEFYKNPDQSKEVVNVSQGTIIEKITTESEEASKGNNFNDIFVTAPTGAGKSLLYQIPAIYLAEKHNLITIIISPLIALMEDQVNALEEKGIYNAVFINSNISFTERQKRLDAIHAGHISILYLSPELLLSYSIEHFIGERSIGLFVIDEAHLVTTWGRDFRVDYWFIGNYLKKIRKRSKLKFPITAFTATAAFGGPNDLVFETIESLNMVVRDLFIGKARRDDIEFDIKQTSYNRYEKERENKTIKMVESYVKNNTKALVYFPWTRQLKITYSSIDNYSREYVNTYYGDLYKKDKSDVLENFKMGDLKVVLATKAFGMGVDISDIEEVYHHAPSGSLSDYVQEIGRVARIRGIQGRAKVDFSIEDLRYAKILYGLSSIKDWQVKLTLKKLFQIYLNKKSRNFLVSIEDFSHIFDITQDDCDNKVKSALVLIEQDLIKKYNYPAVIVRPKSLFAEVFCWVRKSRCSEFERKYYKYIDKKIEHNESFIDHITGKEKKDIRTIFKIRLNDLWENEGNEITFPKFKADFFTGALFKSFIKDYLPVYELNFNLKKPANETLRSFTNHLKILENSFRSFGDSFFQEMNLVFH